MSIGKTILVIFFSAFIFSQSFGQSFTEAPIAGQKVELVNKVELFPNPTTEFIYVEIHESTLNNPKFEMFSIIGTKVNLKVEKINSNKYKIPVKDYASGYYMLILKDEGARFSQAFKFAKI